MTHNTLNIPHHTYATLQAAARRAGVPVEAIVRGLATANAEQLRDIVTPADRGRERTTTFPGEIFNIG